MNKTKLVLNHLLAGNRITSYEAFAKFGATRLADIIFRLRKQGYEIETEERQQKDRYGNAVSFCEYFMKGESNGS